MKFSLDTFASDVRSILQRDPSRAGREKVRALVEEALKDESFVNAYVNDNTPDRQVIYEDADLGFCVCAHVNRDAREANPHDHGSSWAIYGQAFGETEMSDWEIVEPAAEGKPGKYDAPKSTRSSPVWPTSTTKATCTRRNESRPPGCCASKVKIPKK
jgi:hypothetical protein